MSMTPKPKNPHEIKGGRANISAWAIRNPIPTSVLFLVLTIVGIVSFILLPINANPNISFPMVAVTVSQAGAAPSELETQVTQRVEGAIAGLSDVKHVQSIVNDGLSFTTVEFQLGVDPDRATNDVRDAVSRIRSDLPTDIEEPIIKRIEVEGAAILTYAINARSMSDEMLSWYVDDTLSRELLAVKGVSQVSRLGGAEREILVELQPDKLMAFGVTAAQVNNQLRALNIDLPGGRSDIGQREQLIRTLGESMTVDQLKDAGIQLGNGRWIRLRDIATITDGAAEKRTLARYDGKPVVAFSVFRAKGSSEVDTGERIRARVKELQERNPQVSITEISSTVDYTRTSYDSALHTLIEGMILAAFVVLWFLRDKRATLISAIAMPLSVLPTFAAMKLFGFTLNGVSLLALTLVIGILVDDAIVEIENIVRHMRGGKRPYPAAIEASDEIGLAVMATTMSIVVVFLPVSFLDGIVGQYFREFGITVAVAVLASLLVARLLTPLLAAYFLVDHDEDPEPEWLRKYQRALHWSLAHRGWTLCMGIGFFILSIALLPLLPTAFIPEEDQSRSVLSVELPPGARLQDTDAVGQKISGMLKARSEVKDVFYAIGASGEAGQPGELRKIDFTINLLKPGERELTQKQFEAEMRQKIAMIPDIRSNFAGGISRGREVSVLLTGDDPKALYDAARSLELEMRKVPQVTNVLSNVPLPRPEVLIQPRTDEAASLGISVADIAQTVRIATQGDIDAASAKFTLGDRQVPIRVLLPAEARTDLETLRQLRVTGMNGATVPLASIASIGYGNGEVRIDRFDRSRRVSVDADLNGATLGDALTHIYQLPTMVNLPKGVRLQEYGEAEYMAEMFGQFGMAMGAGILMIYAVLVLLFKDFLHPATILTSLPLSIGGALMALLITGKSLDMPSMIGLIMLMGIVTKNAILLADYAIESERGGMDQHDALMDAGHKRARPIIMTTIAMVAGMLPAALGIGDGAGFRAPMAIGVIGGLITSTLLSLVFVPVVYSYVDQFRNWIEPKLARLSTVRPEDKIEH